MRAKTPASDFRHAIPYPTPDVKTASVRLRPLVCHSCFFLLPLIGERRLCLSQYPLVCHPCEREGPGSFLLTNAEKQRSREAEKQRRQRHWMPDRAGHDRGRRGGHPCVPFDFASFGFASFDSAVATLRTGRAGRTGARVRFGLSPLRTRGSRVVCCMNGGERQRQRQKHWMPDRAGHDRKGMVAPCPCLHLWSVLAIFWS